LLYFLKGKDELGIKVCGLNMGKYFARFDQFTFPRGSRIRDLVLLLNGKRCLPNEKITKVVRTVWEADRLVLKQIDLDCILDESHSSWELQYQGQLLVLNRIA